MTVEISMFQQRPKQRIHWASRSPFFHVSTSFAPWSSRGLIDSPVDLLPFMDKKAFISGLHSFLCYFLNSFTVWPASYLHVICYALTPFLISLNLFPTPNPLFASFLPYEMDAKVFIWAPNLWYVIYFPDFPLMHLKHFQISYKLQIFKNITLTLT